MTFKELNLIEPILSALSAEGYTTPTPIQAQAIPSILQGKDLLGCAQTGTGKTAAFAIPVLQQLYNKPLPADRKHIRTLVLTPTRELALQIDESFKAYGKKTGLKSTVVFGGVGQAPQVESIRRGTDVLVATPGRLLDLIGQGYVKLAQLEILVLDEADRMLDMGFIHDIKKIMKFVPSKRQTLFFSATMPTDIVALANTMLNNPVSVSVTPVSSTAETITQSVYFVEKAQKPAMLIHLLKEKNIDHALVFTRTKHGADKIARGLCKAGIKADAIHGNKGQTARQNALSNFKDRSISILVATDIAARGIDVDDLSHVFNFDIPNVAETYVHRIGRSGRAGAKGRAISLCDSEERGDLRDIQKLINMTIPVEESLSFVPQKVEYKAQPAQSNNIVNQPRPGQRGNANSSQRNGGRSGSGQQFSNRNKSSNQGRNQNKRFSSQPA